MTPEEYRSRVESLLPAIKERALYTEQNRHLPSETAEAFIEAGLFRALQPKHYGGYELDAQAYWESIIRVGTVCASSAWVLGVVGVHNWQLGLFPKEAQDDVWGNDSNALVASSLVPQSVVKPVDGGYHLQGRWRFSSGSNLCDWAILGASVENDPDRWYFLVPRSEYEIEDTWYSMGLCGTGSNDIVIDGTFVPEHRVLSHTAMQEPPGRMFHDGPLYQLPYVSFLPYAVTMPAIGVALGAIEHYRTQMKRYANIDDSLSQVRLSEATSLVDLARHRAFSSLEVMMAHARAKTTLTPEESATNHWNIVNAVSLSIKAVDMLFEYSGGAAIFLKNPMQRAWRDIHAIRAHKFNNREVAAVLFGKSESGLLESMDMLRPAG